jgi:hypothetical protein
MPAARGPLNGPGPQEAYAWLSYVGYDQATNRSQWYWEAIYIGNGGGSWNAGATNYWSLSGFAATSGTFVIGSPGTGDILLGSGYFWKSHDANGYLAAGNMVVGIDTVLPNVGDGSASISSGTPPRIPKPPSTPAIATLNSVTTDGANLTITSPSDNGGSAVLDYLIQYSKDDFATIAASKTSGAASQSITGLEAGTDYKMRYRARNAIGSSGWSAARAFTTDSGIYVSDGTKWIGKGPAVSDGAAFVNAGNGIRVSDGDSWEPLIPVILAVPEVLELDDDASPTKIDVRVEVPDLTRGIKVQTARDAQFETDATTTNFTPTTLAASYLANIADAGLPRDWYVRVAYNVAGKSSIWGNPQVITLP